MSDGTYDHIVIGLGALGSATVRQLAVRGASVLGLERFELGHGRGESEDHSRLIRVTYHTEAYARLAQEAYRSWEELEVMTGQQVVNRCGCLDLYPEHAELSLETFVDNARAAGERVQTLSAREVMERWPQFSLDSSTRAAYHAKGGFVMAGIANRLNRRVAVDHGAELREHARVDGIDVRPDGVRVRVGTETFSARSLVVAAGPWTNEVLAMVGASFPLTVTQEQVTYLVPARPMDFHWSRFPVWMWMARPSLYGFPIFGESAVKAAIDAGGREVTADSRSFDPDPDLSATVRTMMADLLPGSNAAVRREKTCLYTLPPDRDFILDLVPGHDRISVAVGGGHAFKFASVIGEIMADFATAGETAHDVAAYTATRPILTEVDPPKNFLL
ncbi:N-methyl-L-tryptophan oxidase [Sphaerisporangium sp. NPDC051011]|uniref:N-methyl-L-tryptophan oxidase n=1 Tax=Sphaerisporangium sp. NPDC051011 TaxID=3155792 RepID=UPI0033E86D93